METQALTGRQVGDVTILPDGSQIVTPEPVSEIMVSRVRQAGPRGDVIQLTLEQFFKPRPNPNNVLGNLMQGHPAFNNNSNQPRKRVFWQNVSKVMAQKLRIYGLQPNDWEALNAAPDKMLAINVPFRYEHDGTRIPAMIIEIDSFQPRTWIDRMTGKEVQQQPKRAGQDGDILLHDGKKIYRNTILSIQGMDDYKTGRRWNQDIFIPHTNQVQGSTTRVKQQQAVATGFKPFTEQALEQQDVVNERLLPGDTLTPYQEDKASAGTLETIRNADPNNPQLERQSPSQIPENNAQQFAGAKDELGRVKGMIHEDQNAAGNLDR